MRQNYAVLVFYNDGNEVRYEVNTFFNDIYADSYYEELSELTQEDYDDENILGFAYLEREDSFVLRDTYYTTSDETIIAEIQELIVEYQEGEL